RKAPDQKEKISYLTQRLKSLEEENETLLKAIEDKQTKFNKERNDLLEKLKDKNTQIQRLKEIIQRIIQRIEELSF
ncbi:MAG: hypothetical protein J7K71_04705, partial [Candidatus Omnitrophica bacterium]|nr:hypothetical protein [Candidatus Omnitrophota bacterium]